MLIVPMGSGKLVNMDCVEVIFTENDECADGGCRVIARGVSGKYITLGWYKDELRANSVVQEIAEKYENHAQMKTYKMPRE